MDTYQRTQPHMNVGTIGPKGHGKSTLTAAIATVMAKRYGGQAVTVAQLDDSPDEVAAGSTIDTSWVEYRSAARHYAHVDCPGSADHIGNLIGGTAQMDAAILVVSATEGLTPQVREHLVLARQHGAGSVIPFINKCDQVADAQALAKIEADLRSLLQEWDYPGNTVPVVRGSARGALQGDPRAEDAIAALISGLESATPVPQRYPDVPLRMPIDKTIVFPDNSVGVTGRIEGGTVKNGDTLTVRDLGGNSFDASCLGVRCFDKLLDQGQAGDRATVIVRGLSRYQPYCGQFITVTGRVLAIGQFESSIQLLSRDDGGVSDAIQGGSSAQVYFGTTVLDGSISFVGIDVATPGDSVEAQIKLDGFVPGLRAGTRFSLRQDGITIGIGTVTKV